MIARVARRTAPDRRTAPRPGVEVQRLRLLEAAKRVLARRAVEELRVEDVLIEAQVSRQTYYRCFDGLEPLVAALHAELETFLREAVARALDAADAPGDWIDALLVAVFDAAVAAGPALAAMSREEARPGSPREGARARRQAALAELMLAWGRARLGVDVEPWRVRAVLLAVHELCVSVCDPARVAPGDAARARDAARALARGLLLEEGRAAGLWDVVPRPGSPPPPPLTPTGSRP